MKEEEKIFAGRLFDARSKELRDLKHTAHVLCQKFNALDEYDEERLPIIKEFIGKIGENYYFQGPIQFNYGCHTFIGENVMVGPTISLMTNSHPLIPAEKITMRYDDGHVSMSEYAEEIPIGNNAVIGAGSVVKKDVPADHGE